MAAASFPAAIAFTLSQEGGFVDSPADPGGATNLGITLRTLQGWWIDATISDLWELSAPTATEIYQTSYWLPCHGDELPPGLDLAVFDMGVNAGPDRSIKLFQAAAGLVADGVWGPKTAAVAASYNAAPFLPAVLERLIAQHTTYYKGLPDFPTFGRGWLRRVAARQVAAQALLGGR